MLKSLRKHARYFYVLFVLIILSFVLWVPGMNNDQTNASVVARVGDEVISMDEFWRSYDNAERRYRDIYKEKYNDDMQRRLKRDVLGSLVQGRILIVAAAASGITVSDQEVNDSITSDPSFARNGSFSVELYRGILKQNRITPVFFENSQRNALLLRKMRSIYENAASLAPSELKGVPEDNELRSALEDALIDEKKQGAVLSFVNAYKNRLKMEVNEKLVL